MQTERAKRMDSAGEEASLNSPELPWNQLCLKRRTESRIQLRRRVCFTGPAAAAVTGVLAILILAAGSVSSDSEFVTVPSSVKCTEGQDCILSCTFNDIIVGRWDEQFDVIWRQAETHHIVHSYFDNREQLAHQLPQYVNRTSLFDSELQRGNASLLLKRVREEDAGEYECSVYTHKQHGSGLIELVPVPDQPTAAAITAEPTAAAITAEPTAAAITAEPTAAAITAEPTAAAITAEPTAAAITAEPTAAAITAEPTAAAITAEPTAAAITAEPTAAAITAEPTAAAITAEPTAAAITAEPTAAAITAEPTAAAITAEPTAAAITAEPTAAAITAEPTAAAITAEPTAAAITAEPTAAAITAEPTAAAITPSFKKPLGQPCPAQSK
ncbi:UNVERIFIED_CONTAM: hypothetical protein FKN15_043020 [Acipenser sinensis]